MNNAEYARIGGVSLDELNILEVEMLRLLGFELYVYPRLYCQYAEEIVRSAADQPRDPVSCSYDDRDTCMENERTLPSSAEFVD